MKSLMLAGCLALGAAQAQTYIPLNGDASQGSPVGPNNQATRLFTVNTIPTAVDLNGTVHGKIEYVGAYGSGRLVKYCANYFDAVWDSRGTLVSSSVTLAGCNKPNLGIFEPQSALIEVPGNGVESAYAAYTNTGYPYRAHWQAYLVRP